LKTRIVVGAVIVIVVMLASIGYYVMMSKPSAMVTTMSATAHEPSADTLVPPVIFAVPTPDSEVTGNAILRSVSDDVGQSGLGIGTKLLIGD